jgi:hypothetical protein
MQIAKLMESRGYYMRFLERNGVDTRTLTPSAEALEAVNLAGPVNGSLLSVGFASSPVKSDIVAAAPSPNFFLRGGYTRNGVLRRDGPGDVRVPRTAAEVMAHMSASMRGPHMRNGKMHDFTQQQGYRDFASAFDEAARRLAQESVAAPVR